MTKTTNLARFGRAFACVSCFALSTAYAATINVDNLADDVFPDAAGAIFDSNGMPIVLATPKCTLRMAIASANLDLAVGGANGCAAGSGPDAIVFAASLNLTTTPGTITLADRGMSEAPATISPPLIIQSALIASRQLTITGPGSAFLTIDGNVAGNSGRRPLLATDGDQDTDSPFQISGLRLLRGRAIEQGGGCLFSSESATINDVIFESCESVGGPTQGAFGGALGVGSLVAGTVRPDVTLTNSLFIANRATRGNNTTALAQVGAANFGSSLRKVGKVAISNSRFLGNTAESIGALLVRDASVAMGDAVSISSSEFISNTATGNAASLNGGRFGGFQVTSIVGNVALTDIGAVGNTANQERGGFSVTTVAGTTTITNSFVSGNTAIFGRVGGFEVLTDNFDSGGNCLGTSKNPVNISDIGIQANLAATNTAGFRVVCSGNVGISSATILGNEVFGSDVAGSGGNGAGNIATNLAVTMSDVQVIHNRTSSGAVDGGSGLFTVQDNTSFDGTRLLVRDNYVQQNQGGLTLRANGAGRTFTLTESSLFDNRADGVFSALSLDGTGNYTLKNTTLSGNRSAMGGAVFVNMNAASGSNAVLFENVTSARNFGGNTALGVGGGAATSSGTLTLRNTILGSPTGGIGTASAIIPTIPGVSYAFSNSIIENSSLVTAPGICGANGTLCNLDAKLENLARNGADITRTHALRSASPALDAGSNTGVAAFDQRGTGFPRIVGAKVDIGAFESPPLPTICTLDVDGNNAIDALTDGLILIRAMFGLTGTSVTNGVIGGGATRTTWAQLQPFLNGSCGTSFAP